MRGRERKGKREGEEEKGRGPQGLVHTPMFEILKNTLLTSYLAPFPRYSLR